FVAGARMRSLLAWLSVAFVGAAALAYLAPYRRRRLLSFLNPWEDPLGDGLQAIQSQVGIASGGLFGVGLGASRAKWGFLPFAHTDFIFAIVAEEVGLIGASALIGGFLLIAWFGFKTAISAPDRFGTLLAAGITSWLLIQAFLNIGMVLGVLPITGEPLPFVSAGGSSLVTTLAAAGLLTGVSRRARA
ncbi:MAG: FtsW/RodA/SpoVE family cell cycle protein, partial [Acidimicrobiia bacterium]|nr:FtsW/RodA/SpoVE family cell cycle protein [Acidimicrobiia bacterium]